MNTSTCSRQGDIAFQTNLYNDPNPSRRHLHTTRRNWVTRELSRYTRVPGTSVVEVGVGAGIYTRLLADRECRIMAIDINTDFLNNICDLPDVTVMCADATRDLGLRDYDVALCSEVLEHVPPAESMGMLATLYRSVRPGGIVILTTPQRMSTMETMVRTLRFPPMLALARRIYGQVDDLGHINVMRGSALRAQVLATGFEIVQNTQVALYLPLLAEFGGEAGKRIATVLERWITDTVFSALLWQQCFVLRRPA